MRSKIARLEGAGTEEDQPGLSQTFYASTLQNGPNEQMFGQGEGGGAAGLQASPFGVWDYRPQQLPSSSSRMPQTVAPAHLSYQHEQNSYAVLGERPDISLGSPSMYPGDSSSMPGTMFSSAPPAEDEFQSPNAWGLLTEHELQLASSSGAQMASHSETFEQTAPFGNYGEDLQQHRPGKGQAKLKKQMPSYGFQCSATGIRENTFGYEASTSLNPPHSGRESFSTESYDACSSKIQTNSSDVPSGRMSHIGGYCSPAEFGQMRGQFDTMNPSYRNSGSLQLPSTSSGYSGIACPTGLRPDLVPQSFESVHQNCEPTFHPQADCSTSGAVQQSVQGQNFFSGALESRLGCAQVKPERKQKKRSKLTKAEYQKMSLEELLARKKELNRIAAKEYRERNKQDLMKSEQEYEEERQRHGQLNIELLWIEARIAALVQSFEKLSAS